MGDLKPEHALLWGGSSGGTAWLPVGQEVVVAKASSVVPSTLSTLDWHILVRGALMGRRFRVG